MSTTTLIIGESGTGKSSSIRNLNYEETFIISSLDKPLPFRGFKNKYIKENAETRKLNFYVEKDPNKIILMIRAINERRPEIKTIILDDFQYIMVNHLINEMRKDFSKFTEIAKFVWNIINTIEESRSDINCYVLSHSELTDDGKYKAKTVGKMVDNQICFEGMFSTVLHSLLVNGSYKFLTQNDGAHIAKSPIGMFSDRYIDNDLNEINKVINEYFNQDINQ